VSIPLAGKEPPVLGILGKLRSDACQVRDEQLLRDLVEPVSQIALVLDLGGTELEEYLLIGARADSPQVPVEVDRGDIADARGQ